MAGEFDLDEQLRQAGRFDPNEMTAKLRERFASEGRAPADPQEVARRQIEKERAEEASGEEASETLYEQQRAERDAQKEETEDSDNPGEHGGTSGGSSGGGSGSSVAFEPQEEVRSEPEADQEPAEEDDAESEPEPAEQVGPDEDQSESVSEPEGEDEKPDPAPSPVVRDAPIEPTGEPLSYNPSVKFFHRDQYDKAADTRTQLKLPTELVDAMRTALARQAGEDFATSITNVSLVSAFCAAKLGAELDTDANTEAALAAFRRTDPQMGELTDQVATLVSEVSFAQDESVRARKAAKAATERIESLELAVSYWLAERLLGVSSGSTPKEVTESNIEKVEALRGQFRDLYDKRSQIEEHRRGRRAS